MPAAPRNLGLALRALRDARGLQLLAEAHGDQLLEIDKAQSELDGTCMKQHAGTNWLTTTAGVTPGEHITVVFAIFDLSDSILDSYAFIDNFAWGCDPTGEPQTEPEG